jgi:hypothetical protein
LARTDLARRTNDGVCGLVRVGLLSARMLPLQ